MAIDQVKINRLIQTNLSTCFLHLQTFSKFKCCNIGKDIYIIATGPSAKKFVQKDPGKYIGVNRAFEMGYNFDYYFIQDYSGKTKEYIDALDKYNPNTCQKFYGITTEWSYDPERTIPESHAIKAKALRYRTDWAKIDGFVPEFAYDISTTPLGCFGSVTFPALQFALWTYPKRIFLVGCDCTTSGYAYSNEKNFLIPDKIVDAYKKFKAFAHKYYPDVEIISINPVGLKGIFKDVFN